MINRMQQVVIAMRRRESEAVITALQGAGVLHIRPLEQTILKSDAFHEQASDSLKEAERLLARVESTIAELGAKRPVDETATPALPDRASWAERIEAVATPVAELSRERTELQAEVDAAENYAEPTEVLGQMVGHLDESRRIAVIPFLLHSETDLSAVQQALQENLADRFELSVGSYKGGRVGAVATLASERDAARAALGKVHLAELRLPGRFESLPLSKAATELADLRVNGRERLSALNAKRKQMAEEYSGELFALRDSLKDSVAVNDVRTASARGKYSLVMEGYVPTKRIPELEAVLMTFGTGILYEIYDVDEHHDQMIPVDLENSNYVRPFQSILGLMSPPKYGTFDPTGIMAFFIPLFFGIIIADIGYGLLFLAFGLWLLGKARRNESWKLDFMGAVIPPKALGDLAHITNWMAGWSILWGFFTGEFFGTLLEKLGFFYFDADLINRLWGWTGIHAHAHEAHHFAFALPILFPRLEIDLFANVALVFALLFGVVQVLWGWGIRLQQGIQHKDALHTWEGIAMFSGLIGLVAMAFASTAGKDLSNLTNLGDWRVIVMWIGFLGFILGLVITSLRQNTLMEKLIHPLTFGMELVSQGGAIVSYARIFAVGLVSAVLAKLSTETGIGLAETLGPLGIILGILVGTFMHAIILALTLIGHILQPIRLHLLEFLNPTGFHSEASPVYNPLRRLGSDSEPVK